MKPVKCVEKTNILEALQWTGDNLSDFEWWLDDHNVREHDGELTICEDWKIIKTISLDCWVIKTPYGLASISHAAFRKRCAQLQFID